MVIKKEYSAEVIDHDGETTKSFSYCESTSDLFIKDKSYSDSSKNHYILLSGVELNKLVEFLKEVGRI